MLLGNKTEDLSFSLSLSLSLGMIHTMVEVEEITYHMECHTMEGGVHRQRGRCRWHLKTLDNKGMVHGLPWVLQMT